MGQGDLSSSTRDWTCTSCLEGKVLTTGLLVKSQRKSVFSQFWRPQVQEGVDKTAPSGESIPCPSPSFWSCQQWLVFLGSGLYSSNLCSVFTGSPFLWCLIDSPFSSQGLSLGLRSTLIQDVLISMSLPSLYPQRLFRISCSGWTSLWGIKQQQCNAVVPDNWLNLLKSIFPYPYYGDRIFIPTDHFRVRWNTFKLQRKSVIYSKCLTSDRNLDFIL